MRGYWNGQPAEFVGVEYEVKKPDVPTWWQSMFVGQKRQGIQITYGGETWIIDNEHGDGFYKVTRGMGSPQCPHKSTNNAVALCEIPDNEINKVLDKDALKLESENHRAWMKENHPEEYERSEALRKRLEAHRNKFNL